MRLAAAVDIGGTRTKIGVVQGDGTLVERMSVPTLDGEPGLLVARITGTLQPLLRKHTVAGLGVSVAGFLSDDGGAMVNNANLPALRGFPLRDVLSRELGLDCVLEVDSNASTIAEYRIGAGQGATRLLGVTIGTGVGGGVILRGQVVRHTGGCAGDLGHVIVAPGGRACSCGASGCLEAMACAEAVVERGGGPVDDVIVRARASEARARDALAETGRWLGLGLASLAPLYAPATIVVGGGVAAAGDLLLGPARESFARHAGDEFRETVRIVGSWLEGWEGMIGAGLQFLEPLH